MVLETGYLKNIKASVGNIKFSVQHYSSDG
jgi:hypothetical protein